MLALCHIAICMISLDLKPKAAFVLILQCWTKWHPWGTLRLSREWCWPDYVTEPVGSWLLNDVISIAAHTDISSTPFSCLLVLYEPHLPDIPAFFWVEISGLYFHCLISAVLCVSTSQINSLCSLSAFLLPCKLSCFESLGSRDQCHIKGHYIDHSSILGELVNRIKTKIRDSNQAAINFDHLDQMIYQW